MTHFADQALSVTTEILENISIATDTKRIVFRQPEMARAILPGQFVMLRLPGRNDPLIGRAFAVYDVRRESLRSDVSETESLSVIEVVYAVKGKLTSPLSLLKAGDRVVVWGPLGNSFDTRATEHLIMVAGGIGQTPFLALAKEALGRQRFGKVSCRPFGYAKRVSLCYGARSAKFLAGVEDFEKVGVNLLLATEDGSLGKPARVTDLLTGLLESEPTASRFASEATNSSNKIPSEKCRIVCCGPEPMMAAVAQIADNAAIDCQVSLETPMACGIGICFSCVAKIGSRDDWDYKRTCVEGPIFDASDVLWD